MVALPNIKQQARRAKMLRLKLARTDPNTFCEAVIKDEKTARSITQAPVHEAWQHLMTLHSRLLIWSHIESGKTQQVAIARTLFELGRDPNLRILILSNTAEQAKKIGRAIKAHIEHSEELKLVFPDLKPGALWGDSRFSVKRTTISKDPTVQCVGVHGNVTGSRLDVVIMDDILDFENTRTPSARNDLWDWYRATVAGRLLASARVLCIGTAYHPDDFLHRLAKQSQWEAVRYPVINTRTGELRWQERWPMERIIAWKEEHGPIEFARQLLCEARSDEDARFKQEWIQRCLVAGDGKFPATALKIVPKGYSVYTGVDLAVQRHAAADLTVLFTIAVDPYGQRHVMECKSGRWAGPEIVREIVSAHQRFQSICIVENNAAQDFILQFTRHTSAVPIRPFTTGRNKAHPEFGVESIGAEMANGKWIIPNHNGVCVPELQSWIDEMLYYSPQTHTGDRLMASWFAREGARSGQKRIETVNIDLVSR